MGLHNALSTKGHQVYGTSGPEMIYSSGYSSIDSSDPGVPYEHITYTQRREQGLDPQKCKYIANYDKQTQAPIENFANENEQMTLNDVMLYEKLMNPSYDFRNQNVSVRRTRPLQKLDTNNINTRTDITNRSLDLNMNGHIMREEEEENYNKVAFDEAQTLKSVPRGQNHSNNHRYIADYGNTYKERNPQGIHQRNNEYHEEKDNYINQQMPSNPDYPTVRKTTNELAQIQRNQIHPREQQETTNYNNSNGIFQHDLFSLPSLSLNNEKIERESESSYGVMYHSRMSDIMDAASKSEMEKDEYKNKMHQLYRELTYHKVANGQLKKELTLQQENIKSLEETNKIHGLENNKKIKELDGVISRLQGDVSRLRKERNIVKDELLFERQESNKTINQLFDIFQNDITKILEKFCDKRIRKSESSYVDKYKRLLGDFNKISEMYENQETTKEKMNEMYGKSLEKLSILIKLMNAEIDSKDSITSVNNNGSDNK